MSDRESKKSMDDVLASIRRIVRAEKQPETPGATDGEVGVPLALTQAMRMSAEEEAEASLGEQLASDFVTTPPIDGPPSDGGSIRETIREVLLEELAGDAGEALVRKIIRDEMTAGETGGNISRNVLRLIRSEIDKAMKI